MKYFSTLIKPASSLCNMSCKYCFYRDVVDHQLSFNHSIMSQETMQALILNTLNAFQEEITITFAFQGGEPTLAGLDFFQAFIKEVNKHQKTYHHIQYSIQTNGLLLDESWYAFFKENNFLVGISLDGMAKNHDFYRLDNHNNPTYEKIIKNIRALQQNEIEFNILTVLTSKLAKKPKEYFDFLIKNQFHNIQFIPCLAGLDQKDNPYSLHPKEFFFFYDTLFELWLKQLKKGNTISIGFFDQILSILANLPPTQCGALGYCSNQFVIESSGDVYPCDFYVLNEYQLGNIKTNTLEEMAYSKTAKNFIYQKKESSTLCQKCRYFKICYGQCKRQRSCFYDQHYCGIAEFLAKHEKELFNIAKNIK